MQELETIQPEESREGSDAVEAVESTEAVEEQALDDATHEPGARVEEEQSFEQAEIIEEALTEAIEPATEEQPGSGGDVSATPINIPKPGEETETPEGGSPGGDVSATPINIPKPGDEAEAPEGGSPGGDVAATPINLPYTPDADVAWEDDGPGGSEPPEIDPTPIFEEAGEIEPVSPEEVLESMSEEQKAVLNSLDPKDQEDLLRVIANSQRILPDQMPGDGNIIY